jgi:hypothetical protein
MLSRFLFPAAFFLLLLLPAGCARPPARMPLEQVSQPPPPQVSAYVPKKVYALDFTTAWEGTLRSLRETNMPLTVQDREKGILRTDYIKGTEIFRLEKAFSTRYKYNIILFRESNKRTVLNVRCLYEIKEKSGQSFRYANDLFPDEVIVLEKELYRIIEPTLSREEASRTAGSQAKEKEAVSVPAIPAASKPQETPPGSSPKAPGPPPPAREVTPIPPRTEQTTKAVSPPPKTFFVTKKNTHLREQPSTHSKIILTLKPGRKVEKIGESGNWVRVKIWETTTGWILKDLLQEAPP